MPMKGLKRGSVILAALSVLACDRSPYEVRNYDALEHYVAGHQVGEDTDYWIEMTNMSGAWERVGLIFGYMGDYDECLKAIDGLARANPARTYRCAPANRKT